MNARPEQPCFIIDGNILDALAADPQTLRLVQNLQARHAIEVSTTFVQITELNNTRDEAHRERLLKTLEALRPTRVATAGVWDCTNWDECTLVGKETEAR